MPPFQPRTARDCYKVLKLTRTATHSEIKSSYRKLALLWHPDKNGGDAALSLKFRIATEAYDVLSDPLTRGEHDRDLGVDYNQDGPRASTGYKSGTSQRGYDHPSRAAYGPRDHAPPGSTSGRAFDYETWRHEHYGDARTVNNGNINGQTQSAFANYNGAVGDTGVNYMGKREVGREQTLQDAKDSVIGRMNQRREARNVARRRSQERTAKGGKVVEEESACSIM